MSTDLDPSTIGGVVFDLDGTLVDSYRAIADSLNHAREQFGLAALDDDQVRRHVGRGLEVLIAELVGPGHVERGVTLFRQCYASVYRSGTRILPDVAHTCAELHRRGFRLAVASNKPARFSGPILEAVGIDRYFDTVSGPDVAGVTKPEPGMIRGCLTRMGVAAARALYVGDMVLDVDSGDRAGVAVVLVAGGSSPREALVATGRPVIDRLSELLALLPETATA